MSEKKYRKRPWLSFHHKEDDPRDVIPWERRHWLPYPSNGTVVECHERWNMETRSSEGMVTIVPEGCVALDYSDMDNIWTISEEYDCTLMEATISHIGEERFSKTFVQEMLRAPKVYAMPKAGPGAPAEPDQELVFVDPRAPKKRGPGRPRKVRLEEASMPPE